MICHTFHHPVAFLNQFWAKASTLLLNDWKLMDTDSGRAHDPPPSQNKHKKTSKALMSFIWKNDRSLASISRAKRWPAESTHEQVHGRTEIQKVLTLPIDFSSVFQRFAAVKAKLGWSVGQATQERRLPSGVPDRHAQISGNLFHNIAASCFPSPARTEGRGRDLGRGQALWSGSSFTPHVPSATPRWSFLAL